jgi:hypothetical protein
MKTIAEQGFEVFSTTIKGTPFRRYLYLRPDLRSSDTLILANPAFSTTSDDVQSLIPAAVSVENVTLSGAAHPSTAHMTVSQLLHQPVGATFASMRNSPFATPGPKYPHLAHSYVKIGVQPGTTVSDVKPTDPTAVEYGSTSIGLQASLDAFKTWYAPRTVLQQRVVEDLAQFDAAQAEEKKQAKRARADADGFIPVTKGAKKGVKVQQEAQERMKKKMMSDFYRFQVRQSKTARIADLRRKFEEDKKAVQKMKMQRKFY